MTNDLHFPGHLVASIVARWLPSRIDDEVLDISIAPFHSFSR